MTYTQGKYCGRLIGLTLQFQSYDNNGKVIRVKFFKPFVVSSYHPCNRHNLDEEHWKFNGILDTILSRAPYTYEIIMGSDMSISVLVGETESNVAQ